MKCYSFLILVTVAAPAYPQARFEVASVRPSLPGSTARDARFNFRGDRFEVKAATVGDILDMLGGFRLFRVTGGPAWMTTDRYDIAAKADRELSVADRAPAVMALLSERFQLESHKETRDVPGIVLRTPQMPKDLKPAGHDESYSIRMNDRGDVAFTAAPMSALTNYLSQMWRSPVMDETELKEAYDFVLSISRVDQTQIWGDRLREAITELGFRVENRKIPLEVTVVDRCERPSAN